MTGRSSHELEKWYLNNESSLKLNEGWQARLNATTAALSSSVVIPSPPPMASLTPYDNKGPGVPHHFAAFPASASQSKRPDYPMAIPFKPKSMQPPSTTETASTSASGMPGYDPVHTPYHAPYAAHPALSVPAYGHSYTPPVPYGAMYPQYATTVTMQSHLRSQSTANATHARLQQQSNVTAKAGSAPNGARGVPLGENRQPYYPPPGRC